jgi:hypothetical protein
MKKYVHSLHYSISHDIFYSRDSPNLRKVVSLRSDKSVICSYDYFPCNFHRKTGLPFAQMIAILRTREKSLSYLRIINERWILSGEFEEK